MNHSVASADRPDSAILQLDSPREKKEDQFHSIVVRTHITVK